MSVIIKKRQIIMSALVLALGSAVFVNWYFTKPDTAQAGAKTDEKVSYSVIGDAQYVSAKSENGGKAVKTLDEIRLSREKSHDEAFDKLNSVINNSSSSQAAVDKAAEELGRLTDLIKLESDIQALVQTKCGFDCIVVINGEKAEIVCEKGSLESSPILQIKEIVLKHTSITSENITISENK